MRPRQPADERRQARVPFGFAEDRADLASDRGRPAESAEGHPGNSESRDHGLPDEGAPGAAGALY